MISFLKALPLYSTAWRTDWLLHTNNPKMKIINKKLETEGTVNGILKGVCGNIELDALTCESTKAVRFDKSNRYGQNII